MADGYMYLWSNEEGKEFAVVFEDVPTAEQLSEYDREGYERQEDTTLELHGNVYLWPLKSELRKF